MKPAHWVCCRINGDNPAENASTARFRRKVYTIIGRSLIVTLSGACVCVLY